MKKKERNGTINKWRNKLHHKQEVCYLWKKEFSVNDKKYQKVRDYCHYTGKYRGAAHDICNLRYKTSKEIPVVFHNGSTYDYQFIIKELAKEFEGQFECLGENAEKYIIFSVPIKKEVYNGKTTTNKIKFIDSFLDICHAHYQVLLITYLKGFIMINAKIVSLVLTIW